MISPSVPFQWLSLVSIVWLQAINGPNTDFPVYSSQLKDLLSISQVQLNNLAFASDAGKLFGWSSGVAAIYLPLWAVLLVGATLGFVGYGVQYLFVINKIPSLSYFQVFMLSTVGGNAMCWINTVCYIICIKNFTSDSRIAVGLATSYVGLSAKIYIVLADVIFNPRNGRKAEAYLLLNAVAPLVLVAVTSTALPLAREIEMENGNYKEEGSKRRGFMALFVIALVTGFWTIISSMDFVSTMLSSIGHTTSLSVLLAVPLVVPVGVKIKEALGEKLWSERERKVHDVMAMPMDHVVCVVDGGEESGVEVEGKKKEEEKVGKEEEEVGVSQMVRRLEFWLYYFGYLFGPTVGLVFLNNLGQIVESRGLAKTPYLVSMASSFGFFGRFIPPLLDFFFPRCIISGPAIIAAVMAPMAGSFFLLLSSTNLAFYLSTAVIGACTGAITSIAVTTTSELFGKKHFSVNHNVVVTNIPLGSFLFGYLAAILYQREEEMNKRCMGTRCYNQTFMIWGSLCTLGTILSLILYRRTHRFSLDTKNLNSKDKFEVGNYDRHNKYQMHLLLLS